MKRLQSLLLWAFAISSFALYADDEFSKDVGPYIVHYSVFNSDFLTPEVARQYGLTRSKSLALINVSIIDKATQQGISASVRGNAYNLAGQNKSLAFKEIKEQNAIYYIANFRFSNEERLSFKLIISPDGSTDEYAVDFTKTVYVN
ncbi:DUF4426 domain-containing protein [Pleionea litopenaei]|uniref:DUF4426 domain-containing protein n=1 Tax=Pleionea litopenaei TaxID=3070815 RepID=A0AA51RQS8_9GAMM|nr:DUF4426 domain-containing protein [Pleionea sp. HL-JVS1]WMS85896.1 DUF4426 domain-containing protein [Pleionea sp. HL-JVS1]